MTSLPNLPDPNTARDDGEAFGRMIGAITAAEMTRLGSDPDQARVVGAEGAEIIMARADRLADAGLDQDIVTAWTEAAADAFNGQMDSAAALLASPADARCKH